MVKQLIRQRDFSGGQAVAHAKRRDDEAIIRASARQLENGTVLSTGAWRQRPGRTAMFAQLGRTDPVRMSATVEYKLSFGNGDLTIRNSSDAVVVTQGGYAWTPATAKDIVWDVFGNDIFICFPGQIVKVASWDGASTWTFLNFAEFITNGGQKRTPFYRIAPKGITLTPSAATGAINITFSAAVLVAGMVGTRLRYQGRQLTIATVTNPTTGTANVNEPLLGGQRLTFTASPPFTVGDRVEGSISGAQGEVAAIAATTVDVVLLSAAGFHFIGGSGGSADNVIGPTTSGVLTAAPIAISPPASTNWDQEVMNSYQGYPRSVVVDQNRLIFCDFPGVPEGISWSAIADPYDHYVGADADEAFFELVPQKSRVYHLKGGADQFVFTDLGIYYIPISTSNPLRSGSVDFRRIPGAPAGRVEPVSTPQGLLYVGGGLNRLLAIVGTGQTAQPYIVRPVSDLHSDLFSGVTCIEVEEGDGDPPESRAFAVNANGSVTVGTFTPGKEWVGWYPWSSAGLVKWISALGDSVLFSTDYTFGIVCEQLDPGAYLDCAVLVNAIPAAVGTLSLYNGATVDLMDGIKFLGRRAVAAAAIVVQSGDDFSAATVMAGYGFTMTNEPFISHVQGGQSVGQLVQARQFHGAAVAVQESTGFRAQKWNPNDADWDDLGDYAATYRAGENQDIAPPLREEVVVFKGLGTEFDPRFRIIKDFPGPLTVLEISTEIGS